MTTTFSPCGRLLAATSMDGRLSVWDIDLEDTVLSECYEPRYPLCGSAWNPAKEKKEAGQGEIALCDNQGHLGTIVFELPSENTNVSFTKQSNHFSALFPTLISINVISRQKCCTS